MDDEPGPSSVKRVKQEIKEEDITFDIDYNLEEVEQFECDSENSEICSEDENLKNDINDILTADKDDWQEDIRMKNFPFIATSGLLVDLPSHNEPYDYFRLLIDDTLINDIVEETNRFSVEVFLLKAGYQRSRITEWKDLTHNEFLRFLGLVYHMGTWKLNRLQDYWRTHRLFGLKCFSQYISRDRFLMILRCLHFVKNLDTENDIPQDPLYKIRPIIDYFNNKMRQIYYPGKNLLLEESMVLWRGRLVPKQYFVNKHYKYGMQLYMLTEPNGMILNFTVNTGQLDRFGKRGHPKKIIMDLMEDKLNSGHSLFMDNYYNSFNIAKELLNKKTYCTGTLLSNKKDSPKDVMEAKLNMGETKSKYNNGVMIGKWYNKQDVTYISTEYPNIMVEVQNKRGQSKLKPLPIVQYNKNLGLDKHDQMMSYYPCLPKSMFWYKRLGIHIFQLLLINSYFLFYKYSGNKVSFYNFRLAVIERLLPEEPRTRTMKVTEHFPHKIEKTGENSRIQRKKCRQCAKKKMRKDTIYDCLMCPEKPGLCLEPCFRVYHKNGSA